MIKNKAAITACVLFASWSMPSLAMFKLSKVLRCAARIAPPFTTPEKCVERCEMLMLTSLKYDTWLKEHFLTDKLYGSLIPKDNPDLADEWCEELCIIIEKRCKTERAIQECLSFVIDKEIDAPEDTIFTRLLMTLWSGERGLERKKETERLETKLCYIRERLKKGKEHSKAKDL